MYTIKDAARIIGIHPKTLRRWETKGKFIPRRTLGNQRRFSDQDLALLTKLKAGEPIPLAPPKILTLEQAAAKLHVSPATVKRWTRTGKLKIRVNNQLQPGYYAADLENPTLQKEAINAEIPLSPIPPESLPAKKTSVLIKYSGVAALILTLLTFIYLWFQPQPIASPAILETQTPTVDLALPRTAQFLDGRITLGLATGDLFYADAAGKVYIKNSALIDQAVYTRTLQLLPSQTPESSQIGQLYVDQNSGNLKYFDGLDWIDLNLSASISAASQNKLPHSLAITDQDLDLTLGTITASASAASLRITLAGDQSVLKVLGGAGQELLTLNDDVLYPITLSQPVQMIGNLTAPKLIDIDQNTYFIDPANTDLSLSLAGNASLSATLKFNQYGESLTNPVDDYLVFSGGLGIGGTTSYGFSPAQNLNIRSANLENELTVAGRAAIGTDVNSSYKLNVNGNVFINGDLITESNTYPDYVFEPDYPLLSPLQLKEFITTQKHLPGVPSIVQVENQGLNLKQLLLALLEKTEENTLYLLDLYDRLDRIVAPTVETEILTTRFISPLTNGQINISGDASISGTLYAKEINSTTIDQIKKKISELADSLTPTPAVAPAPIATETAILDNLPPATESSHLSLASLEANAAFFKDYLAVLGQTTLTDVKINHQLSVNSITGLNGQINFLAGLLTLDETGQVIINGNLIVAGAITTGQIKPLPDQELAITIASSSAVSIYSDIGPLATFSGQTASVANLKLEASGTATIAAGMNHSLVRTDRLTDKSQVVITFTSDYTPATKYWVKKDPTAAQFTLFTNYPVNQDTTLDWLIIN